MRDLLLLRRSTILQRWFDLVVETYPPQSQKFIKEQKNPFANPVGSTLLEGIEGLYEELLRGMDSEKMKGFLEPVIRIRAVQGFSPSQALSFIPSLKGILREELRREAREKRFSEELYELDSRIDSLTLLAFDLYMGCREKICEMRARELRYRPVKGGEKIRGGDSGISKGQRGSSDTEREKGT